MIEIRSLDFSNAVDRINFCDLLNHYALDPMGGEQAIEAKNLEKVCEDLMNWPGAASFMAFDSSHTDQALGLINCFLAYSTFKAKPILNIHDMVVRQDKRGLGVGHAMLSHVQAYAQNKGCCKLTLEVLSGNDLAIKAYRGFGFDNYQLQSQHGHALFFQKWMN